MNDDSFHNYFINGDWNLDTIKNDFGDGDPAILTRVLRRRSCSVDVIKLLIQHGAEINCPDENGHSPLMVALKTSNDEALIRELLAEGAEVNKLDVSSRTPLLRYLQREDCSVGIIKALLDFKVDVNRVDRFNDSPLWTAIGNANDDAVIRLLVERGAEVNDLRNLRETPLLVYLRRRKNCSVETVKLMLEKGANVNCVDVCGCSPLMTALKLSRNEAVIQALLENGANVNKVCEHHAKTPLMIYVGHRYFTNRCSIGIVKLLLCYKADVNWMNYSGHSPLMIALINNRKKEIIQVLLGASSGVDTFDSSGRSLLCIAFRHSSNNVVKLLLDAGISPTACKYHRSPLHCATDFSHSGLRKDILKLLLEAIINVNGVDEFRQSALCFALQHGTKARDIQLLLDAGAALNTCAKHSSSLMCITESTIYAPLREDVVQLLRDNGACVVDEELKVLKNALLCCKYETGAIQLLLDLPGVNAYVVSNKLLLHHAVQNPFWKLDTIKLLVDRKAQVDSKNESEETPLHCAARNRRYDQRAINLLLKNGVQVNAKNKFGETPLMLAVKKHCHAIILKELLLGGAHIGKAMFGHEWLGYKCELLVLLACEWETCEDAGLISSYQVLAKFFLLQNPEFDMKNFQCAPTVRSHCIKKFKGFLGRCLKELGKMDSLQVGFGHTLRMLMSRVDCAEEYYDVNQILVHLVKNSFPVFSDVIAARISRSTMEAELTKVLVYTNKTHPVGRVYLNCDILCKISKYLNNNALLSFIVAFYKPFDQNDIDEASPNETLLGKRRSEPSTELPKHQKTCR